MAIKVHIWGSHQTHQQQRHKSSFGTELLRNNNCKNGVGNVSFLGKYAERGILRFIVGKLRRRCTTHFLSHLARRWWENEEGEEEDRQMSYLYALRLCDSWLLTAVGCSCKTVFLDFFGGYSKILITSGEDILCLYLHLAIDHGRRCLSPGIVDQFLVKAGDEWKC